MSERSKTESSADSLIADVRARGNYWSAFDQGKLAALQGRSRDSNPHHMSPIPSHDWLRGFDSAAPIYTAALAFCDVANGLSPSSDPSLKPK